jgi:hypothetical protein
VEAATVPEPEALLAQAVEATGLEDMGPDGWQEGLGVLVDDANRHGELSELGLAVFTSWVRRRLRNRLRVIDWAHRHPDEVSAPVTAPLVVTGLGRSGTTYLLELLSADPANRALMKWEATDCVPPPESAGFDTDPRITACITETEQTYDAVPQMRAVHYERGDGPTECLALLGQSFLGPDFSGLFTLPEYARGSVTDDQRPAYTFHRIALGVLQSRAPGSWTLKDPWHPLGYDALFECYPDARVVVLHRDPVAVIPSMAALSIATAPDAMRVTRVHPEHWGRQSLTMLGEVADRDLSARERFPRDAFLDLAYTDLLDDPVATVERIYAFAGRDFSQPAESAVRRHIGNRPQHQYGVHRYSAAEVGLTAEQISERFAGYTAAFPH